MMNYNLDLTSTNEGLLRVCPCSIGSAACFPSETSMLTGWKASGDICAILKSKPGDTSVPLKLQWLSTPPCWFKIRDDWALLWGGILSSDGLWLAEAADRLGLRNLAHSWPVVISSSRLNEPRPNSKSPLDLEQEESFCKVTAASLTEASNVYQSRFNFMHSTFISCL